MTIGGMMTEPIQPDADPAHSTYLIVKNAAVLHRIEVDDIMYCESINRQINVYCSQFEHRNLPNLRLDDLEKLLPSNCFVRIGRSHILNRRAITFLEKEDARCWLTWRGRTRDVLIYGSNVSAVEQSAQ